MSKPYKNQNYSPHLRTKTLRLVFGLYVFVAWLTYNIYSIHSEQHGFRALTSKDMALFIFLVYGSTLCLLGRMALYCSEMKALKNYKDAVRLTLWQLFLIVVFLCLAAKVIGYTHGWVDWYGVRIYAEFEFSLFLIVVLQILGYYFWRGNLKLKTLRKREDGGDKKWVPMIFAMVILLLGICIFGISLYRKVFFSMDNLIRVISQVAR